MKAPMSDLKKWIVRRLAVRREPYDDLVNDMAQAILELQDEGCLTLEGDWNENYAELTEDGERALRDIDEGRL